MDLDKLRPAPLGTKHLKDIDLWALVENSTNGIWLWLIDRGELYWSKGLVELFGYDLGGTSEVPNILELTHPDDRERHEQAIAESYEKASDYYVEVRLLRDDGEPIWIAASGIWRANPGEPPHTMFGFVREISDRIVATNDLAASE